MQRLYIAYAVVCIACAVLLIRSGKVTVAWWRTFLQLGLFVVVAAFGAWSLAKYAEAARDNRALDTSRRVVAQFFNLPVLPWPSEISRFFSVRGTERFEDAPIRIVEFSDPLCVDCRVLFTQLRELETEFAGKMNVVYQFFPLEARCNDVVEKDKHPGACDLSYMLAADSTKFRTLHDEIYQNMDLAKDPAWRADFAKRHGVEGALSDTTVWQVVHRVIRTGVEYEKTSDKYNHGIRSTPTMIVNGRMIIGTLPIEHMRAILQALVDTHGAGSGKFMENWVDPGCVVGSESAVKDCKAE